MECQGIFDGRHHASDLPVDAWLLSLAIANTGAPILIADADDCVVWTNRAFAELTGVSALMVAGNTSASFGRADAHARLTKFPVSYDRALPQTQRTNLTGTRGDGAHFVAEAVVTPLYDENGVITHSVTVLHDVTQSATALENARSRATRDELTGVACRSHIVDMLHTAFAAPANTHQLLAVLFIDLDGFKKINDSFGHMVGDCLLRAVAARIVSVVRRSDTVARFGGDEFLVFLPAVSGRKAARQIGKHIVHQLAQPFAIGAVLHHISASVGLAFRPDHAHTAELLLIRADEAMYLAKSKGGNQIAVANREGETTSERRFEVPPSWESSSHVPDNSKDAALTPTSRND